MGHGAKPVFAHVRKASPLAETRLQELLGMSLGAGPPEKNHISGWHDIFNPYVRSGKPGEALGKLPRRPVIVGQTGHVVAKRVKTGGRENSALPHRAAHLLLITPYARKE